MQRVAVRFEHTLDDKARAWLPRDLRRRGHAVAKCQHGAARHHHDTGLTRHFGNQRIGQTLPQERQRIGQTVCTKRQYRNRARAKPVGR